MTNLDHLRVVKASWNGVRQEMREQIEDVFNLLNSNATGDNSRSQSVIKVLENALSMLTRMREGDPVAVAGDANQVQRLIDRAAQDANGFADYGGPTVKKVQGLLRRLVSNAKRLVSLTKIGKSADPVMEAIEDLERVVKGPSHANSLNSLANKCKALLKETLDFRNLVLPFKDPSAKAILGLLSQVERNVKPFISKLEAAAKVAVKDPVKAADMLDEVDRIAGAGDMLSDGVGMEGEAEQKLGNRLSRLADKWDNLYESARSIIERMEDYD